MTRTSFGVEDPISSPAALFFPALAAFRDHNVCESDLRYVVPICFGLALIPQNGGFSLVRTCTYRNSRQWDMERSESHCRLILPRFGHTARHTVSRLSSGRDYFDRRERYSYVVDCREEAVMKDTSVEQWLAHCTKLMKACWVYDTCGTISTAAGDPGIPIRESHDAT